MLQRWLIPSVIIMGISLIGGFATHEYLTKKNERREYRVLVDKKTEWLIVPELECLKNSKPKSEEQQPFQIKIKDGKPVVLPCKLDSFYC